MNIEPELLRQSGVRQIDLRRLAEFYAAGLDLHKKPFETQRLIRLALNEAEALAVQSGVPELVLPTLAEEKVRNVRKWALRQARIRRFDPELLRPGVRN